MLDRTALRRVSGLGFRVTESGSKESSCKRVTEPFFARVRKSQDSQIATTQGMDIFAFSLFDDILKTTLCVPGGVIMTYVMLRRP